MGRRLADLFHRHPRVRLGALLAGPIGWLVIGYLGSLAVLLIASFWTVDALSGETTQTLSLDNYNQLLDQSVYRDVALRTIGVAAAATITDAILAFPIAFYMAKIAGGRARSILIVAVLMPLWSGYLVKVYTWRTIMSGDGALDWLLNPIGLGAPTGDIVRIWLVMSYMWLPFMILPRPFSSLAMRG